MTIDPATLRWGHRPQFDEASRAYGAAAHLAAVAPPDALRRWTWDVPPPAPLDQGNTSKCVAHTWVHLGITAPVETTWPDPARTARTWYAECKTIDGMPDEDGTSVIAGAKVARRHGLITGYRWCNTEPELATAVSWVTPAVIGIPWYPGMMTPDRHGLLRPTGRMLGRHAALVIGIDPRRGAYQVLSSWGAGWADNGVGLIMRADMSRLITRRRGGEVCIPVQAPGTTGR